MKIHRVVQMLGATTSTGKLADDMYDLNYKTYYSKAEDKDIPISHMDFQHLVRAFVKQNDEDVRTDTQEGKIKELEQKLSYFKKLAEDNFITSVKDSELVDDWKKKYDALRETYAILFDSHQVESSKDTIWKERYEKEVENAEFWKKMYSDNVCVKGKNYVFSEIPNDCDGQRFTDDLKKYLNKESYKMRIRGQYLKEEIKETEGWRKYERGQPIEHSKCLRVYIDIKKGE